MEIENEKNLVLNRIEQIKNEQREKQIKRRLCFAVLKQEAQIAFDSGFLGHLAEIDKLATSLSKQLPGIHVNLKERSINILEYDCCGKHIVWNENIAKCAAQITPSPTGFTDAFCWDLIFDPKRRIVVENSSDVNSGHDAVILHFNPDMSGSYESKRDLIPFDVDKIFGSCYNTQNFFIRGSSWKP